MRANVLSCSVLLGSVIKQLRHYFSLVLVLGNEAFYFFVNLQHLKTDSTVRPSHNH